MVPSPGILHSAGQTTAVSPVRIFSISLRLQWSKWSRRAARQKLIAERAVEPLIETLHHETDDRAREAAIIERTPERELLPMARALDLAVLAWSPLGSGVLTGKYRRGETPLKGTRLGDMTGYQQRYLTDHALDIVAGILGFAAPELANLGIFPDLKTGYVGMAIVFALIMIGVASGGRDVLQPLKGIGIGGGSSEAQHLPFKRIKTVEDLNREIQAAGSQNKFVMLDFYADWCTYCKDYEKNVFPDPRVQQALSNVVLLQADVTANDERDKALLKHLQIPAPPAILFFEPGGQERRASRLVGLKTSDEFVAHIENALR